MAAPAFKEFSFDGIVVSSPLVPPSQCWMGAGSSRNVLPALLRPKHFAVQKGKGEGQAGRVAAFTDFCQIALGNTGSVLINAQKISFPAVGGENGGRCKMQMALTGI